jgi:phospholipid/cholesterol/gamma-HCH transport system substrate-binding protein
MKTQTQKIRLGIFIFISFVILVSLIMFFAVNKLFEKTDTYFVSYHGVSVSGLEVGSPVNYLGIKIGTISNIFIDPQDVSIIIVELALQSGTPIKKDAYADIISMGITGLKTIEIRGGSNLAESLREGEFIKAGASAAEEITGKANVLAEKAEKVINNLQLFTNPENLNKFSDAAENINLLAGQLNTTIQLVELLIKENRTEVRETIKTANLVAGNINESSLKLKQAIYSINNIIQSDTIQDIVGNAHDISQLLKEANIRLFIENLAEVADRTRQLLYRIDQELDINSQELTESVQSLRITLSNLEETSNRINSDPSILIRGFRIRNIPDKRLK